jgi:methyl-accepting chemotaxis protein
MALVKASKIAAGKPVATAHPPSTHNGASRRKPDANSAKHTLSERLAAATEELASGLTEASSAANELRSSMEQIAAGAEEAAGASQE